MSVREWQQVQVLLSATITEVTDVAKKTANNQQKTETGQTLAGEPAMASFTNEASEKKSNLENCLKVLASIQDQIRFADTKAAFMFGINTLMFGFAISSVGAIKKALAVSPVPASAWVGLVTLIVFGLCSVLAVGMLIYTVMSRFGALAPKSRVFFGHIATSFGKDYAKYVAEVRAMSEEDWLNEVGTQIVETSHIALTKHSTVRNAALITIVGLVSWVIAVFSVALLP
jgi:hypothetical protein